MNIIFRVDSSITIGTGHMMRCLTLADALKKQGYNIDFICRDLKGNVSRFVSEHGHSLHLLLAPKREDVQWKQDSKETSKIEQAIADQIDWLIVDNYALDYRWASSLRQQVKKIMVIDDLADRKHDCDILLDQTYGRMESDYHHLVPEYCQMLLSTEYALLRPEFAKERKKLQLYSPAKKYIRNILVCMGGADIDNISQIVLQGLEKVEWSHPVVINVILGEKTQHYAEVKKLISNSDLTINLYNNVANMAEFMSQADLAIGAGGTTSWERCSLGLPTIVIGIAENQNNIIKAMDEENAIAYIGDKYSITPEAISKKVHSFIQTPFLLKIMKEKAAKLCDANGCQRVTRAMKEML